LSLTGAKASLLKKQGLHPANKARIVSTIIASSALGAFMMVFGHSSPNATSSFWSGLMVEAGVRIGW
jgi:hypothetical protein